jgi:hypothetical protein
MMIFFLRVLPRSHFITPSPSPPSIFFTFPCCTPVPVNCSPVSSSLATDSFPLPLAPLSLVPRIRHS